jgi:hypothetical protein
VGLVDIEISAEGNEKERDVDNDKSGLLAQLENPAKNDNRCFKLIRVFRVFHQQNFQRQAKSAK